MNFTQRPLGVGERKRKKKQLHLIIIPSVSPENNGTEEEKSLFTILLPEEIIIA